MSRSLIPVVLLAAALSLAGCGREPTTTPPVAMASHDATDLVWHSDWQTAFGIAAEGQRPVLVNFSADWCIWCKRYDASTFADREVRDLLARSVVLLRVAIDGNGAEKARRYTVQAPPTLLVLDAGGQEIGRILGYMPPTAFLERLTPMLGDGSTGH